MEKITIVNGIETGLNIIAQDLVWKKHTQNDIDDFIKQFKFEDKIQ